MPPDVPPPEATPSDTLPFPEDPDVQLMLRLKGGDESALTEIIERWKHPLINFFYRSVKQYELAEDLSQVTFVRIYRSAEKYQPQAKFSTYLFHIARRLLINEFRRQQRKPLDAVDPAEIRLADDSESERASREIEEAFQHALGELPENQRTALLLFKQQEMSYAEIAEAMEASESAVKTWIFRGRQILKQALKDLV